MSAVLNYEKPTEEESRLEYLKTFEKLSKIYRMGCDFEQIDGNNFKVIKGTPTIYCYNYTVAIYPKSTGVLEAHILTSINFEKRLLDKGVKLIGFEEVLEDGTIRTEYQYGQSGEFVLRFPMDELPNVVDIFKIRKARNQSFTPYTKKNLHDFLRFNKNISPFYGDILKSRLSSGKTEDSED